MNGMDHYLLYIKLYHIIFMFCLLLINIWLDVWILRDILTGHNVTSLIPIIRVYVTE